jgi:carbamoyl-phosphate synthase large subunit
MKINILFTCAGRRNYLINYFKAALNGQGNIIATDVQRNAPALIDADIALLVPDIYDNQYIPALKKIIYDHQVTAIISLNDLELPILAKYKSELEKTGAKILISNSNVIKTAFDKWETFNFIKKIGLKTPKTYLTLASAMDAISKGELEFPLVLKPRWGSASIGIEFPESVEELQLCYDLQKIKLKKSILNDASKEDIDQAIIIQEKLIGIEYGMDVLNDLDGNYYGTFLREKLSMRSGETDKATTVIDASMELIGNKLGSALKHTGTMDCDLFLCADGLYVLELNPRFGGGYPFSHEGGINTAAIYLEWLKGNKNIEQYNNYKANISFAKCDRLIQIPN